MNELRERPGVYSRCMGVFDKCILFLINTNYRPCTMLCREAERILVVMLEKDACMRIPS